MILVAGILFASSLGAARSIGPATPTLALHCNSDSGETSLSFDLLLFYRDKYISETTLKSVEFRNLKTEGTAITRAISQDGKMTSIQPPPKAVAFFMLDASARDPKSGIHLSTLSFVGISRPEDGGTVVNDISANGSMVISRGTQKSEISYTCVLLNPGNKPT